MEIDKFQLITYRGPWMLIPDVRQYIGTNLIHLVRITSNVIAGLVPPKILLYQQGLEMVI
jgi:hypothetical protein